MRRREHIHAPYAAYNGATITCQAHLDTYNSIQDDINRWLDANRPAPEWLLDYSFRHFLLITELAKAKQNETNTP